jgi:hypothetical protein
MMASATAAAPGPSACATACTTSSAVHGDGRLAATAGRSLAALGARSLSDQPRNQGAGSAAVSAVLADLDRQNLYPQHLSLRNSPSRCKLAGISSATKTSLIRLSLRLVPTVCQKASARHYWKPRQSPVVTNQKFESDMRVMLRRPPPAAM